MSKFVSAIAVVTNDSADLTRVSNGLYIGGAGVAVTFTGVPVGTFLPIKVKRVYATGTTATLILAAY